MQDNDELVTALKDERVVEALGTLFEGKLQPFITLIFGVEIWPCVTRNKGDPARIRSDQCR